MPLPWLAQGPMAAPRCSCHGLAFTWTFEFWNIDNGVLLMGTPRGSTAPLRKSSRFSFCSSLCTLAASLWSASVVLLPRKTVVLEVELYS